MDVQFQVLFDVIAGASCIGAMLMVWWGYCKWDAARRERRAEFLWKLLEKFREEESIQRGMYAIDFNDGMENIKEGEKDRILSYMAYICYLKKTGVVSDEEFAFFEYEITRTLENSKIKEYLGSIKKFADANGCRNPFVALNEYEKGCVK